MRCAYLKSATACISCASPKDLVYPTLLAPLHQAPLNGRRVVKLRVHRIRHCIRIVAGFKDKSVPAHVLQLYPERARGLGQLRCNRYGRPNHTVQRESFHHHPFDRSHQPGFRRDPVDAEDAGDKRRPAQGGFEAFAEQLHVQPPAVRPAAEIRSWERGSSKRCRNDRLLRSGYRFRFRTFRDGYGAILEGSS